MAQGQELALQGGSAPARKLSELLETSLLATATKTTEDPHERNSLIYRIAANPEMRQQAIAAAPMLEAMAQPARPADILAAMAELILLYPLGEIERSAEGQATRDAFLGLYVKHLRDLPLAAIRVGIQAYIQRPKSIYFPKPGEIREGAEKEAARIRTAAYRVKKALETPVATRRAPTEAERAKVREMMAKDGLLDANGKFSAARMFMKKPKVTAPPTGETRQQMAERARRAAERQDQPGTLDY